MRSWPSARRSGRSSQQVIVNLAVNARDAMAGKVDVGKLKIMHLRRRDPRRRSGNAQRRRPAGQGEYTALSRRPTPAAASPPEHAAARSGSRSSPPRMSGQGHRAWDFPQSMASSSNRAASSLPIQRESGKGTRLRACTYPSTILRGRRCDRADQGARAVRSQELWGTAADCILLVEDEETVRSGRRTRARPALGYTGNAPPLNGEEAIENLAQVAADDERGKVRSAGRQRRGHAH